MDFDVGDYLVLYLDLKQMSFKGDKSVFCIGVDKLFSNLEKWHGKSWRGLLRRSCGFIPLSKSQWKKLGKDCCCWRACNITIMEIGAI
jgi:hypothetical protein